MERHTLAKLLQQHAGRVEAPDVSYWDEGTTVQAHPEQQLQVLTTHRDEYDPLKIDKFGRYLATIFAKVDRPLPRLGNMANQIIKKRAAFEPLDDAAFDEHLIAISQRSKFEHSGWQTELGTFEVDVFAVVSDAVRRVNGFRPHREQLIGAMALLEGMIAEMATGEGKTVTANMASIVAAWRGLPCHVVTANDYLAARDCEIGQPLFGLCHVSAASVTGDTAPDARGAGYAHDIVYTTAKDFLADHLRDDLAMSGQSQRLAFSLRAARNGGAVGQDGVVMRGVFQVFIDEADSVLIDEAVTPLIISAEQPDSLIEDAARKAVTLARALKPVTDFKADTTLRNVELTRVGRERVRDLALGAGPFWQRRDRAEELVKLALYAIHMMIVDQHYVIEEEKVVLVDELTGRLARQRTLSLGMQQVLEASLDLEVSQPSEVQARLSFQRYFRRLPKIGGMTGTAREASGEFAKVYGLNTMPIPTHKKTRRRFKRLRVFRTEDQKMSAIAENAVKLAAKGRAILIGVRSVHASATLHSHFQNIAPDLHVEVLNAVNDEEEGDIVAAAGQSGAITVATNMAGRGTDIKIAEKVEATGGLHVIIAETNDFSRIDRQLIGRCARQGNPGTVQRFISLDEEIVRRFLPSTMVKLWSFNLITHLFRARFASLMIWIAQSRAERLAFKQRKGSLKSEIETEKVMI
jgi:preprotein translocase subunit SecA